MSRSAVTLLAIFAALSLAATLPGITGDAGAGQNAAVAAAFPGCGDAVHEGGEWRSYNHDFANTRAQPAETTIGPGNVTLLQPAFDLSTADAGASGDVTGTPVIADGCLYVGTNDGFVLAANADTGEPVWTTELPSGGGVNSSLFVENGTVFASVSRTSEPYVVAFDQATGAILWETVIDAQRGADAYASPVVYDGLLFIGVSGGSAELGDESDRYAFQGAFALIEAWDRTSPDGTVVPAGTLVKKTWVIRPPDPDPENPKDNYAGATIWSTPAVDTSTGFAYVGAGNPFRPQDEHAHANSILKIDLNRDSGTFGEIVAHHKGNVDEYFGEIPENLPCLLDLPGNPPPYYPQGLGACTDIDLDFGASPQLFTDASGTTLVGAGQKSGVYHVADAATMEGAWTSLVGPPSAVGGIVGTPSYTGTSIVGPIVPAGYLWSVDAQSGTQQWFSPVGDGAHWGNPVSTANGVAYTVDFTGALNAYDAATGAPLLKRPMIADAGDPTNSWGGVSIARNTVYASVGMTGLPNGHVIGYRLSGDAPDPGGGEPPSPPAPPAGGFPAAAGPGAQYYGYATPVIVAQQDGAVVYTNLDVVRHDIVQDPRSDGVAGDGSQPWCGRFDAGQCPLFWTPLLGLSEQTEVRGLDQTEPGVYSFYCTLHPGMQGTLVLQ